MVWRRGTPLNFLLKIDEQKVAVLPFVCLPISAAMFYHGLHVCASAQGVCDVVLLCTTFIKRIPAHYIHRNDGLMTIGT